LILNFIVGTTLLDYEIQRADAYRVQQGTLIVWTETDGTFSFLKAGFWMRAFFNIETEVALSFQNQEDCIEIWKKIRSYQCRSLELEIDSRELSEDVLQGEENNVSSYFTPSEAEDKEDVVSCTRGRPLDLTLPDCKLL
jgi:hypothetical protein